MSTALPAAVVEEVEAKDETGVDSPLGEQFSEDTALEHKEGNKNQNQQNTSAKRRTAVDGLTLPPPPAFDLQVTSLSIGVPAPERYLPLPVPIPYPQFLSRKKNLDYLTQTIIRDVDVKCGSGEVLAMCVPYASSR